MTELLYFVENDKEQEKQQQQQKIKLKSYLLHPPVYSWVHRES